MRLSNKMRKQNKNLVKDTASRFEYEENVKEFVGFNFHCPNCDEEFHIHVAHVWLEPVKDKVSAKISKEKSK